jgi:DMSO/TMAO reductase YedYZ molybdopterin-dependent catalytic subunit
MSKDAYQAAVEAGLVVLHADPLNAETSIPALIEGVVMPNSHFFMRNHFPIPELDPSAWRLEVNGLVERPLSLSLHDLDKMPSQSMVATLECAGNGRTLMTPKVEGEPWGLGAVSTAEWTGVPLTEVLDRAGVRTAAREVVFRGADQGRVSARPDPIRFERSLPVDDARESDALLAYAMNGEPLPVEHGYPLRLIVPRFYSMASVKWLTEISAIAEPFEGYYQAEEYQYEWMRDGQVVREPVTLERVRALVTEPVAGQEVEAGNVAVRGAAWSGAAAIERVEVSVNSGPWQEARLVGERNRYSWQWWELIARITEPGPTSFRARAFDLAGRGQPEVPEWNRKGYGANAIQEVVVTVRGSA